MRKLIAQFRLGATRLRSKSQAPKPQVPSSQAFYLDLAGLGCSPPAFSISLLELCTRLREDSEQQDTQEPRSAGPGETRHSDLLYEVNICKFVMENGASTPCLQPGWRILGHLAGLVPRLGFRILTIESCPFALLVQSCILPALSPLVLHRWPISRRIAHSM